MRTDLWSFTLETYALPGVEAACLQLQAAGSNVCLLLCAVWLGQRGVAFEEQRAVTLHQLAQPWHDEVVVPLRQLRTQWRNTAHEDGALSSLREQVKTLELDAERQLLLRLEEAAKDWPQDQREDLSAWLQTLAAQTGNPDLDALNTLRVAVTGT